jgi:hypothetical protein
LRVRRDRADGEGHDRQGQGGEQDPESHGERP